MDEAETQARFVILDCASEDCYGVNEFIVNLRRALGMADDERNTDEVRRVYAALIDAGEVRLHRRPLCSFPYRARDDRLIQSSELSELSDDAFLDDLCVCDTPSTKTAYETLYAQLHGGGL